MNNEIIEAGGLPELSSTAMLDMDKVEDIKDNSDSRMARIRVTFKNGYGISIIRGSSSYGGDEGLYEIAPLDKEGSLSGRYLDAEDSGDDVCGYLTPERVRYYANKMANLR